MDSVSSEASVTLLEISEQGLTHQSCFELGRENPEPLYPHIGSVGYPGFLKQGHSLMGDDNRKCNGHCVIHLLTYTSFKTVSLASFYGESYVELNIVEVSSEFSLQLKFQTSKPRGLLFLAAGKSDYCIVELLSGNVRVRLS